MKLRDLYADYIVNWLTSGGFILRDRISSIGIRPAYDRILTKKSIIKVWGVFSFPIEFEYNITQMVRKIMFEKYPQVTTLIQTVNTPADININSETFRRQLRTSTEQHNNLQKVFEQLSESEQIIGKTLINPQGRRMHLRPDDVKRTKEKADSYKYVYNHVTGGGEFFKSNLFIQAYAENSKDMNNFKKDLENLLRKIGVYFFEVKGNMSQYLLNFGPASYIQGDVSKFKSALLSDENLAAFSQYKTKGLVGGDGALLGIDWDSKLPFRVNFFEAPTAQVILIVAKSGTGKTYAAWMSALSFIADKHHCGVRDIKGGEWERLLEFTDGVVISMEDAFVNSMRLDDIDLTKVDPWFIYKTAIRGTVEILTVATNLQPEDEVNPIDLRSILQMAVQKKFDNENVNPKNPDSFKKTSKFTYGDILDVVSELEGTKSFNDKQRELCRLIRTRCSNFFKSGGNDANSFNREITIQEVIDKPLVIYSFDKNKDTTLSSLDSLRLSMTKFMDTKKLVIRKAQGLHTISYYEELQRSDQFGTLITDISHDVTGSRSENRVVVLLLNALSAFEGKEMEAIASNITTIIAGEVNEADVEILEKKFGTKELSPYLKKMISGETNIYRNCFAIKYDTGLNRDTTIYKVVLPKHMEEKLRTRDVQKKN